MRFWPSLLADFENERLRKGEEDFRNRHTHLEMARCRVKARGDAAANLKGFLRSQRKARKRPRAWAGSQHFCLFM